MPCDGEQECSPHTGQGVTRSRAIAHVRRKPASQPSVRTHRSKAGMAASQHSSTSSSTDSTTERTQQQASAGPAGAQQLFDAWINAWRSLGMPAAGAGAAFQMPQMPSMPAMPDFANAAAAMAPFAGLKVPTAAIPSERLQKLQADYSREAMQLIQQSADVNAEDPRTEGSSFQRGGMERHAGVCVHCCMVSAECTLSAGTGRGARYRTEGARTDSLRSPAVDRGSLAEQLLRAQS